MKSPVLTSALLAILVHANARAGAVDGDFRGGSGGQIVRVTTLAADGPGSLRAVMAMAGPRIVVFEVGGVIDLKRESLRVLEPNLTIAGQTAPTPGITLIRGGMTISAPQVIVEHLRIRPGEAGMGKRSGWEVDGISTQGGAHDVLIRQCSLTWATDENASASGPRFEGGSLEQWREHTSHRIRFQNNLIAEGLAQSTHAKGEHSKGSLVHDNARDIDFIGNLFAHNEERNPLYKGGASGSIVNNLIYNPGAKAMHYNLLAWEWQWQPQARGQLSIVGNVLRAGPSTTQPIALLALGGAGNLEVLMADNIAVDRIGRELPQTGRYTAAPARLEQSPRAAAQSLPAMPASEVQEWVLQHAGARPWERDAIDQRIIADVVEDRGRIISSEQDVGGYPDYPETRRAFDAGLWDLRSMRPKGLPESSLCMGLECR